MSRHHSRREFLQGAALAKTYHDWRKMLEQKDIDAVVCGTTEHTHAPISGDTVVACRGDQTRRVTSSLHSLPSDEYQTSFQFLDGMLDPLRPDSGDAGRQPWARFQRARFAC